MLTETQRKSPHRVANQYRQTYLERSFAEARADEMDDWWDRGLVEELFIGERRRGAKGEQGQRQPVNAVRLGRFWNAIGEGLGRGLDAEHWLPRLAALHAAEPHPTQAHPLQSKALLWIHRWEALVQAVDLGLLHPMGQVEHRYGEGQPLWGWVLRHTNQEMAFRRRDAAEQAMYRERAFEQLPRWWAPEVLSTTQKTVLLDQISAMLNHQSIEADVTHQAQLAAWQLELIRAGANPWAHSGASKGAFVGWAQQVADVHRTPAATAVNVTTWGATLERGLALVQAMVDSGQVHHPSVDQWLAMEALPAPMRDRLIPALLNAGCSPWVERKDYDHSEPVVRTLLGVLSRPDAAIHTSTPAQQARAYAQAEARTQRWAAWLQDRVDRGDTPSETWLVRTHQSLTEHTEPGWMWATLVQLGQWPHRPMPKPLAQAWHRTPWAALQPHMDTWLAQGVAASLMAWSPEGRRPWGLGDLRLWSEWVGAALHEPPAAQALEALLAQSDASPMSSPGSDQPLTLRAIVGWVEALQEHKPSLRTPAQWHRLGQWAGAHPPVPLPAPEGLSGKASPLSVALHRQQWDAAQALLGWGGAVDTAGKACLDTVIRAEQLYHQVAYTQWQAWVQGYQRSHHPLGDPKAHPAAKTFEQLLAQGADPSMGLLALAHERLADPKSMIPWATRLVEAHADVQWVQHQLQRVQPDYAQRLASPVQAYCQAVAMAHTLDAQITTNPSPRRVRL